MTDYNRSITININKEKVYHSITQEMSQWWSQMTSKFLKLGDKAKVDFGKESYWEFKATTLEEFDLIELTCCDANHIHEGQPKEIREEWLNTILRFEISENGKTTTVNLTHLGLTPKLYCYEICKQGWDHYFLSSLKEHLKSKS